MIDDDTHDCQYYLTEIINYVDYPFGPDNLSDDNYFYLNNIDEYKIHYNLSTWILEYCFINYPLVHFIIPKNINKSILIKFLKASNDLYSFERMQIAKKYFIANYAINLKVTDDHVNSYKKYLKQYLHKIHEKLNFQSDAKNLRCFLKSNGYEYTNYFIPESKTEIEKKIKHIDSYNNTYNKSGNMNEPHDNTPYNIKNDEYIYDLIGDNSIYNLIGGDKKKIDYDFDDLDDLDDFDDFDDKIPDEKNNNFKSENIIDTSIINDKKTDVTIIETNQKKDNIRMNSNQNNDILNFANSFESLINDIIDKNKINILHDVEDLINKQNKKHITEEDLIRLIKKHSPVINQTIVNQIDSTKIVLDDKLRHKSFNDVLTIALTGENIMLVGPAGSGKTTIASHLADALSQIHKKEIKFYFNGAIASEYKLSGFIDAQGRVIETAFRNAYEKGGVYLFDEIDASMPQALLAFNAALSNGFYDFPDKSVNKHPDFVCVAAANTFGNGADRQYIGRNQLDAASLDRFSVVYMDYDEELEKKLAGDMKWTLHVQKIRKIVNELKIRHVISPRASIVGAKLLRAGMHWKRVEEVKIFKGMSPDEISKIQNRLKELK